MKNEEKSCRKVMTVFIKTLFIIVICLVIALIFIRVWPAFGGAASNEDKLDYQSRTEYFDYKRGIFNNEHHFDVMERVAKGKKDNILSNKGSVPIDDIPIATPQLKDNIEIDDLTLTWLGHSSLIIQIHGMNILIDPVFSERSSPVSFIGSKRISDVPIKIEDLPDIDILIISHDHYDHLDYNTILGLKDKVKNYIVPLGVENHLERWGIDMSKVHNMAWWEETNINGLTIGCTPARHYSGRYLLDNYKTWWASWVLKDEYHQVFESGDTGYDTHFEDIYQKYGEFDLALMDCAQYDLRWPAVHMNPEESYKAAQTLNAKYIMPIHWGTFRLASHPWDDPVERYIEAAKGGNNIILTPLIGQTMDKDDFDNYQNHWWKEIK